jgi:hypothetical protein
MGRRVRLAKSNAISDRQSGNARSDLEHLSD